VLENFNMAQTLEIKMARFENSPWGFRLHGGADFATPLTIQKVNMQSLSEAAGLKPGDTILAVNGRDLSGLRHKEAQEAIVKSFLLMKKGRDKGDGPLCRALFL